MTGTRSAAWAEQSGCGSIDSAGVCWACPGEPAVEAIAAQWTGAGRPLRNAARLTTESRMCLCAGSLALQAGRVAAEPEARLDVGILAAGWAGLLAANLSYFRDYVEHRRQSGRGNLFLYTLPTSPAAEVAIHLRLGGPLMHLHAPPAPLAHLCRQAVAMVEAGEASAMLAVWSADTAAAALLLGPVSEPTPPDMTWPRDLAAVAAGCSQLAELLAWLRALGRTGRATADGNGP